MSLVGWSMVFFWCIAWLLLSFGRSNYYCCELSGHATSSSAAIQPSLWDLQPHVQMGNPMQIAWGGGRQWSPSLSGCLPHWYLMAILPIELPCGPTGGHYSPHCRAGASILEVTVCACVYVCAGVGVLVCICVWQRCLRVKSWHVHVHMHVSEGLYICTFACLHVYN
jgi:hypothetical protein